MHVPHGGVDGDVVVFVLLVGLHLLDDLVDVPHLRHVDHLHNKIIEK